MRKKIISKGELNWLEKEFSEKKKYCEFIFSIIFFVVFLLRCSAAMSLRFSDSHGSRLDSNSESEWGTDYRFWNRFLKKIEYFSKKIHKPKIYILSLEISYS